MCFRSAAWVLASAAINALVRLLKKESYKCRVAFYITTTAGLPRQPILLCYLVHYMQHVWLTV